VQSFCLCSLNFPEFEMFRQISEKLASAGCHDNPFSGCLVTGLNCLEQGLFVSPGVNDD
jgi:hypothetical protein